MKIRQISVEGLFGIFNHVIPLNTDERITIITGPNGFGKTAILRMLNGFFNAQYSVFQNIPFNKFRVEFDNDSSVEVIKTSDSSEKTEKKEKEDIHFYFYEFNEQKFSCSLESVDLSKKHLILYSNKQKNRDSDCEKLSNVERNRSTDEIPLFNEIEYRREVPLTSKIKLVGGIKWLEKLKNDIHVRLIESHRLINLEPIHFSKEYSTVSAYSEEIAQLIQSKLTQYGTMSQSLDRTFPARLVQQQSSPELTDEQLRHQLNELEDTRSLLIGIGLLDKDENSDFQIPLEVIDESTKNILSVYIADVEKKLSVFHEIASKIDFLRKTVNKKFAYSYKELNFSKEKGFIFKTLYNTSSSNKKTISPIDLSSGEQHELVLLYKLLFKVQPNSLVLIDEPELSLHVRWQKEFLEDLQQITKLADLDVLMATHSPDIIQDRWDLTVELKGPEI
jgi:predicted ATP-binding protein involved in virulence